MRLPALAESFKTAVFDKNGSTDLSRQHAIFGLEKMHPPKGQIHPFLPYARVIFVGNRNSGTGQPFNDDIVRSNDQRRFAANRQRPDCATKRG